MTTKKQPVDNETLASPLTPRDRELLAMQPLMAQFPVAFGNNAVWEEFDGECLCCGKTLRREFVRGIVVRPIPSVAVLEAAGICVDCRRVTRFDYRLHDDMRLTGQREDGWKTWRANPTLWDRFTSLFQRLLA